MPGWRDTMKPKRAYSVGRPIEMPRPTACAHPVPFFDGLVRKYCVCGSELAEDFQAPPPGEPRIAGHGQPPLWER